MSRQMFETTLLQTGKTTTGIVVPPEIIEALGAGKKPAVNVTVNGFGYRSSVAVMGGQYMIAFSSERREASGLKGGDAITVTLDLDAAPRTMAVPDDLRAALAKDKDAKAFFETLSYSNQRRHIDPINAAKSAETRARRIEKSVALFREGKS